MLKDTKQWDSWHHLTMTQARAQDVDDVLNPDYVLPPSQESLFEAKQNYLYTTFERILQTDKGKSLVRTYEEDSDAQQIFKELCKDALRSTLCKNLTTGNQQTCMRSVLTTSSRPTSMNFSWVIPMIPTIPQPSGLPLEKGHPMQ